MKRAIKVGIVIAVALIAAGCSLTQVKVWFRVHKHKTVTTEYATRIGNAVNARIEPNCDENYTVTTWGIRCAPNNVLTLTCGSSPVDFIGPFKVVGWDHFGLDKNGDGIACNETNLAIPPPTTAPPGPYYPNCDAVRAAGAAPLYFNQPGYRAELDSDGDGVACEV